MRDITFCVVVPFPAASSRSGWRYSESTRIPFTVTALTMIALARHTFHLKSLHAPPLDAVTIAFGRETLVFARPFRESRILRRC